MQREQDDLLYLYGGDQPWDSSLWISSDDRVRGGSSTSYLNALSPERASFNGHLDTQTLGGAGFASQRTIGDIDLDLSDYAGLLLAITAADGKKYTLTLKDTLPGRRKDGRDKASVSWEYDFVPRGREDVLVRWSDLKPTYRGRKVDAEPLDLSGIKRISLMMRSFFGEQEGDFELQLHCIAAKKSFDGDDSDDEEDLKKNVVGPSPEQRPVRGSITFIAVGALSLCLPALRVQNVLGGSLAEMVKGAARGWDWRQVALTGAVGAWAVRLGSYLFTRTASQDGDSRFNTIRGSPPKFAAAFLGQGVWVSTCMMPVLLVNSVPKLAFTAVPDLMATDVLGLAIWAGGFCLEAVADWQKAKWLDEKRRKVHDEEFMTSGLFSRSRFPNYFGEITLWTGIATAAAGILVRKPVQLGLGFSGGAMGVLATTALSYMSPAFAALLVLKVSGVPMSEAKYDKRYGERRDYQEWKRNTAMLIPKLW
ncbi:Fc.00g061340.m01.CDS01 [Cosmosporella sp. VM-42]